VAGRRGVSLAAVVLAAGASSRAGVVKALLPGPRGPLVSAAVQCAWAAGATQVLVTVGAHPQVADAARAADARTTIVAVPQWAEGQRTSLATAVQALHTLPPAVEAAWLLVADQPLLDAHVLVALEDAWRRTGADAAAACYKEVTGVPALVARRCWDLLVGGRDTEACGHAVEAPRPGSPGDGGAQRFLRDPARRIARVEWPDGAFDVDTPADIARLAALVGDAAAR
jgi:molybdenum cofactor cytidylyltransferase